jgi:hypothetical protein
MSTITPQELLKLWQLEKITCEMAIGHLIQNLVNVKNIQDEQGVAIRSLQLNINKMTEISNKETLTQRANKTKQRK